MASDESEHAKSGAQKHGHDESDATSGFPISDANAIEAIEKHIESHLGPVETVFHELVSDYVHVDVHVVPPRPEREFITLITTGMSDLPMEGPHGPRYAEVMISLPPDWPLTDSAFETEANYWPVRNLKFLARMPHQEGTWLGWGHTIATSEPPEPFADNTGCTGLLLLSPTLVPEAFHKLTIDSEKTVEFLAMIPVFTEEMEFMIRHRAEALLERLDRQQVSELLDLGRANVCRKPVGLWGNLRRWLSHQG